MFPPIMQFGFLFSYQKLSWSQKKKKSTLSPIYHFFMDHAFSTISKNSSSSRSFPFFPVFFEKFYIFTFYTLIYGLFLVNFCVMCKIPVFFCYGHPIFLCISFCIIFIAIAPFVKKAIILPLNYFYIFVKTKGIVENLFLDALLYSMLSVTIFLSISHSVDYCSYRISLDIRYIDSSYISLHFQNYLV